MREDDLDLPAFEERKSGGSSQFIVAAMHRQESEQEGKKAEHKIAVARETAHSIVPYVRKSALKRPPCFEAEQDAPSPEHARFRAVSQQVAQIEHAQEELPSEESD